GRRRGPLHAPPAGRDLAPRLDAHGTTAVTREASMRKPFPCGAPPITVHVTAPCAARHENPPHSSARPSFSTCAWSSQFCRQPAPSQSVNPPFGRRVASRTGFIRPQNACRGGTAVRPHHVLRSGERTDAYDSERANAPDRNRLPSQRQSRYLTDDGEQWASPALGTPIVSRISEPTA